MELALFSLIRHSDETGVSGTGRVLDGVIFHTGQVAVCWRTDQHRRGAAEEAYSSIAIYPSWRAFMHVHVEPHGPRAGELTFHFGSPPDP